MEPGWFFWAFGGMLAGNVLVSGISSWVRAIVEVRRTYASGHPWRMVVLTSLFNAGPWILVVAGLFAYYVHAAEWAPWFFGGAIVWVMYLGGLMLIVYTRNRDNFKP